MVDASSVKTVVLLSPSEELTKRHGVHTVLHHLGCRGPGEFLYMDLSMRLKQVFNTWRNWARFERKKLLDAIRNAVLEVQLKLLPPMTTPIGA